MTRDEAIDKLMKIEQTVSVTQFSLFCDYAEALGLIKFDNKSSALEIIANYLRNCAHVDYPMSRADDIVNILKSKGYEIVKKD